MSCKNDISCFVPVKRISRKLTPIENYIRQTVERQFSADIEQIEVDGEVYNLHDSK